MNFDQLLFYFIFYSFLGFILETIYRSVVSRGLVYPGFLYGPYCPIYGFGLIALLLFLVPIKDIIWVFIPAAFIIISLLEYVTGYLLEKLLDLRLWDYSSNFLNINGRISLKFSIYWTILAYIFIHFIHPVFERIPDILDNIGLLSIMKYLIIPLMFIDLLFTVNKAIYTRKEISALDLILNEIEGLKDNAEDRIEALMDNAEDRVEALKNDYEELLARLMKVNRNLFIYGISSRKFPKVIKTIREAGKNLRIYKWFKEDK
jgi:uncharacterized membrane protein